MNITRMRRLRDREGMEVSSPWEQGGEGGELEGGELDLGTGRGGMGAGLEALRGLRHKWCGAGATAGYRRAVGRGGWVGKRKRIETPLRSPLKWAPGHPAPSSC